MKYLAIPYTNMKELSYRCSMAVTAALMSRQEFVFSPILHCHNLADKYRLPKEYWFWEEYNKHMIDLSTEVYCVQLDGWMESEGVRGELKYCEQTGKRVNFITVEYMEVDNHTVLDFYDESVGELLSVLSVKTSIIPSFEPQIAQMNADWSGRV